MADDARIPANWMRVPITEDPRSGDHWYDLVTGEFRSGPMIGEDPELPGVYWVKKSASDYSAEWVRPRTANHESCWLRPVPTVTFTATIPRDHAEYLVTNWRPTDAVRSLIDTIKRALEEEG